MAARIPRKQRQVTRMDPKLKLKIYTFIIPVLLGFAIDVVSYLRTRHKAYKVSKKTGVPVDPEEVRWKIEELAWKAAVGALVGLQAAFSVDSVDGVVPVPPVLP